MQVCVCACFLRSSCLFKIFEWLFRVFHVLDYIYGIDGCCWRFFRRVSQSFCIVQRYSMFSLAFDVIFFHNIFVDYMIIYFFFTSLLVYPDPYQLKFNKIFFHQNVRAAGVFSRFFFHPLFTCIFIQHGIYSIKYSSFTFYLEKFENEFRFALKCNSINYTLMKKYSHFE